ncbi:MAG: acetylxylan esterase [Rhodoferax sp.]|nr:acetylxylan esterase [Rhodoferax sp.]
MPLSFDLPLDRLPEYAGTNPRPDDFDAYWERGLSEMRATDPGVTLQPAEFQAPYADCFGLQFTGTGGSRVFAKLLRPRDLRGPAPAVLHFHGYAGASADWCTYLPYVAAGFVVAALDCRGQGGVSEDAGAGGRGTLRGHIVRGLQGPVDQLYYRQVFLDTAMLARIVMDMPEVDARRVGAYGGSQGGGLALACAALVPGIRRVAPTYPFLCDYQRVWEMDQAKDAYWELQDYFRRFDPRHLAQRETFLKLGYIDVQHLCDRIRAEVLMGVGLMDTVCPPSTQFAAYNRIRSPKTCQLFPDFGHEALPGFQDSVFQFLMQL